MKLESLLLAATVAFGFVTQAKAGTALIRCTGVAFDRETNKRLPIDIRVNSKGARATMSVWLDHKVVFDSLPVIIRQGTDRTEVISRTFTNRNNAPSALYLKIWNDGAEFSEGSYLPEVPSSQIKCWN